jgi:hypothetical protein
LVKRPGWIKGRASLLFLSRANALLTLNIPSVPRILRRFGGIFREVRDRHCRQTTTESAAAQDSGYTGH